MSWEATSPYACCPGGEGLKDRAGQPWLLLSHKNCCCLKTTNIYPWHIPPRVSSCCWNSLIPRGHLALEPARAERPQMLQPISCTTPRVEREALITQWLPWQPPQSNGRAQGLSSPCSPLPLEELGQDESPAVLQSSGQAQEEWEPSSPSTEP